MFHERVLYPTYFFFCVKRVLQHFSFTYRYIFFAKEAYFSTLRNYTCSSYSTDDERGKVRELSGSCLHTDPMFVAGEKLAFCNENFARRIRSWLQEIYKSLEMQLGSLRTISFTINVTFAEDFWKDTNIQNRCTNMTNRAEVPFFKFYGI